MQPRKGLTGMEGLSGPFGAVVTRGKILSRRFSPTAIHGIALRASKIAAFLDEKRIEVITRW